MRILTLNPGSSSLKAAMIADGAGIAGDNWPTVDMTADERAVGEAIDAWGRPDAVAVRFVHGGSRPGPVLLDEFGLGDLCRLVPLAPLHQPLSVNIARLIPRLLPGVPVTASFDTSFHCGLPEGAAHYALPQSWISQNRLRRYGFHGLSCCYVLRRTVELLDTPENSLRLLCCHIGSGVSVTAISGGRSVDTSMGFTPLEGAVMATRCGSVDPGLLLHVLGSGEISITDMTQALYHRSGLAGMTGTSGDIRDVLAARAAGDRDAAVAMAVYLHRLRREIGAAMTSLDRLDAVVFTGGVAEHQPAVIGEVLDGLALLGTSADPERLAATGDRVIGTEDAKVSLLVLTAREDLELARDAEQLLADNPTEAHR